MTHSYFTSVDKQSFAIYTDFSRSCSLKPTLLYRMCGPMKMKMVPAPGNRTLDLIVTRPLFYITTTVTTNKYLFYTNWIKKISPPLIISLDYFFRFGFFETTVVLAPNVWVKRKIAKYFHEFETQGLVVSRLTLYFTTRDRTTSTVRLWLPCGDVLSRCIRRGK